MTKALTFSKDTLQTQIVSTLAREGFVIMATLKIANATAVADWSWWWVAAPGWGCLGFVMAFSFVEGLLGKTPPEGKVG